MVERDYSGTQIVRLCVCGLVSGVSSLGVVVERQDMDTVLRLLWKMCWNRYIKAGFRARDRFERM